MDFNNQHGGYAARSESAKEEYSEQAEFSDIRAGIPSVAGNLERKRLETQFAVTKIVANAPTLESAIPDLLKAICTGMEWDLGELWLLDQNTEKLHFAGCSSFAATKIDAFREYSESLNFAIGQGTPGIVWQTKKPFWSADVRHDACFTRREMAKSIGLGASIAFPVLIHGNVAGVMVFFVREHRCEDTWISEIMADIGHQIGLFIERKRQERSIAQYVEKLERVNQELAQFSHVASHDLREPLRTINAFIHLIADRHQNELSGDCRELFSHVVGSANRMTVLIDDLLKFAELGGSSQPNSIFDCAEVVKRTLADLRVDIDESEARIIYGCLPKLKANESQFSQLIQNLISNAIKYRNGIAPEISISAEARKLEWVFTIRDNGIGVAPESLKVIFLPFRRLHGSETYSGTGIGLAICEKIVLQHGGRIWAESTLGEGTSVYFTFPRFTS